jgi:hypothetical protein
LPHTAPPCHCHSEQQDNRRGTSSGWAGCSVWLKKCLPACHIFILMNYFKKNEKKKKKFKKIAINVFFAVL